MRWFAPAAIALAVSQPACADDPTAHALSHVEVDREADIAEQLAAIPGLTVSEVANAPDGYRYFDLAFVQPIDHAEPLGPTFSQKLGLLHADVDAPMVFKPQGYQLSVYIDEPTALLAGNQLAVEHRFFGASRPQPTDWSKLTIRQAAADHHRIVEAFGPLYRASWVSSGVSKDGMTAMYHRRFYPDDVDATLAYVAPLSYGHKDARYVWYLRSLGEPACRQAIMDYQRAVLARKAEIAPVVEELVAQYGTGFSKIQGGAEGAVDVAAGEFWFAFWQYGDASGCDALPSAESDVLELIGPLQQTIFYATDLGIDFFAPYYYQAAAQLGYPRLPTAHIDDLLTVDPNDYRAYLGDLMPDRFDWLSMLDIAAWSVHRAETVMYIYGDNDPWTAGAFPYLPWNKRDVNSFAVANANHGATLAGLPESERNRAFALLERWTGVVPTTASPAALRGRPAAFDRNQGLPPLRFRR